MYSYTAYCVLLLCCFQVFSMEVPKALMDKDTLECMEKTKTENKHLQNLLDKNFNMIIPDYNLNDFFKCMVVAKGLFKEDGQINREKLHSDIVNVLLPVMDIKENTNEIANKILDECANVSGDNMVTRIALLHNCFVDAAKKHKN